jgi:serine/threonine protein kinase
MTDRSGQQLGNYRLTRLLGHGGFADVYLGEHVYLKTQAAIKVLHTQLTQDTMGDFLAEAQTIARLAHPHIVRVLDFGVENSIPFLVMEYAPNGTLRQRHPRGTPLPLALIVSYVKQIAGALQHAHDQKLVHRDVKPENMLLGLKNEVLLSDFGIATIAQTSRSLHTQDISGTIAYMAPEQVQGKSRPASDQYSLGIITYEWLTGHCPFQGSFAEIASQHMFATPPSLRMLYPLISPDVEQVLMMALAKNPEARFARVEAFANALEQASQPSLSTEAIANPVFSPPSPTPPMMVATPPTQLQASVTPLDTGPTYIPALASYQPYAGVTPSPPSLTPPASLPETTINAPMVDRSRRVISRRTVIGGLFGLAAVAGGGTAWYIFSYAHSTSNAATSTPTPTVAPRPTTQPTSAPSPQSTTPFTNRPFIYYGPGEEYGVAWSPDGLSIASAGAAQLIQVWDASTGNLRLNMAGISTPVYSVAWSPDGSRIASAHDDGTIKIWDASNGTNLGTIKAHTANVNAIAWSPDSTRIVSGGGDRKAKVWDVSTGGNLATYLGHAHFVNAVAWSRNGLYIVSGSGDYTAQVWDPNTGTNLYTYHGHSNQVLALAWSLDSARIASASDDTTVQVWNAMNGGNVLTYRGHADYVVALAWSPDGTSIVSGGGDHTRPTSDTSVQVWDPTTGNRIHLYTGHSAEVEGVAWAPDSKRVASASRDTTVQIWQAF